MVQWSRCIIVDNYSMVTFKLFHIADRCSREIKTKCSHGSCCNYLFEKQRIRWIKQILSILTLRSWPLHMSFFSPCTPCSLSSVAGIQYLYVWKGHACACGISGEMSTKSLILGSKLIKAMEQMVQTWSGHNETVSGETNRTWQDSCEGFVRWPRFRHLPGVRLYSNQERRLTAAWKLLSSFLKSNCIRPSLLPPNMCLKSNFCSE